MAQFLNFKKVVALFFVITFFTALFAQVAQGMVMNDLNNVGKAGGKKRVGLSGTQIISYIMDIAADVGGDTVGKIISEFLANLKQTMALLQNLAQDDTIDSINFLLRNSLSSVSEAARSAAAKNTKSSVIQASDFGEFLEDFKSILIKRCKGKSNFSPLILPQLELVVPELLNGLIELYKNFEDFSRDYLAGWGITFNMLSQGTSFLSLLERPEYVSKDTFKQFVSFPQEIQGQFETVIEELVNNYIDPSIPLETILNMGKMYAKSFASRRAPEHEDL